MDHKLPDKNRIITSTSRKPQIHYWNSLNYTTLWQTPNNNVIFLGVCDNFVYQNMWLKLWMYFPGVLSSKRSFIKAEKIDLDVLSLCH